MTTAEREVGADGPANGATADVTRHEADSFRDSMEALNIAIKGLYRGVDDRVEDQLSRAAAAEKLRVAEQADRAEAAQHERVVLNLRAEAKTLRDQAERDAIAKRSQAQQQASQILTDAQNRAAKCRTASESLMVEAEAMRDEAVEEISSAQAEARSIRERAEAAESQAQTIRADAARDVELLIGKTRSDADRIKEDARAEATTIKQAAETEAAAAVETAHTGGSSSRPDIQNETEAIVEVEPEVEPIRRWKVPSAVAPESTPEGEAGSPFGLVVHLSDPDKRRDSAVEIDWRFRDITDPQPVATRHDRDRDETGPNQQREPSRRRLLRRRRNGSTPQPPISPT